jgi:hypothetical protein
MKGPIFIGGCGSSGTTLLRKMINAHPNICCGPEMSVFDRPKIYDLSMAHLYTLFRLDDFDELDEGCVYPVRFQPMDKSYCGLSDAGHRKFYFEDKAQVERMFDQVENPADFLRLYFDTWAESKKKGRWAEKTPNNIFTSEMILNKYQDGLFINVIRDARDVLLSLMQRRNISPYIGIFRWLAATEAGLRTQTKNNRFMTVRYEDLIMQTEKALELVCGFIDEDYDPAMLDYWKNPLPEEIEFNPGNPTSKYGTQPVFTDSVGKWKKDGIDKTLMAQVDLTCKQRSIELGYE